MNNKYPIILIHGAWHASWCWQKVIPLISKKEQIVFSPDLPGHQSNSSQHQKITLDDYAQSIIELIDQQNKKVTLVGHSMAGMIIAKVAEARPYLIHKLVFLNAYLPINGDSIFSLDKKFNNHGNISRAMCLSKNKLHYTIEDHDFIDLFYQCSTNAVRKLALDNLCQQPCLPLSNSVTLSDENYGTCKKIIICSTEDRVILPDMQKQMLLRQPCDEYIQVEGDHSLFFSLPNTLADLLLAQ